MRYLTTGLPPETKSYAIIADEDHSPWEGTRVKLVRYPHDSTHSQLPILLGSWLELASASPSDRVTRLRSIIANGPAQNIVDQSYLEWATTDQEMVGYFCEAAGVAEWIDWANLHGLLAGMFSATEASTEGPRWVWAQWLAQLTLEDDSQSLLRLISASGSQISHALWLAIWFKLINQWEDARNPGQWVVLLANTCPPQQIERQTILLDKLASTDPRLAVVVFVELVQLRLSLAIGTPWSFGTQSIVSPEVRVDVNEHSLTAAWAKLSPNILADSGWITDRMVSELERLGSQQFAFAGTDARWGGSRFYRATIDGRNPLHHGDTVNLFVDMTRDLLRMSSVRAPLERFDRLMSSATSIVRRLGLDALSHAEIVSADEAVMALVRYDFVFSLEEKPEFLAVVDKYLSDASDQSVKELCDLIVSESPSEEPLLVIEGLDLLTWFLPKRTNNSMIQDAIDQLSQFNESYTPNPNTDLLAGYSGSRSSFVDAHEETPTDELASRAPAEVVAELHAQSTDPWDGRAWFTNLSMSVSLHPEWATALMRQMADEAEWDGRAWDAIIRGLDEQGERPDLLSILRLVEQAPSMNAFSFSLSQLVEHDRNEAVNRGWAEQAEIARALWRCWRASEEVSPQSSPNHEVEWSVVTPKGTLARLTIRAIGDAVVSNEKPQEGLSEWHHELSVMIASAEIPSDPTLSVLTGDLSWFLYRDEKWAESTLVAAFDWDQNNLVARKAWGGFLAYGSWSLPVESQLGDLVRNGLVRIQSEMPESMERFVQHHAYLFLNSVARACEIEWAQPLIRDGSVELRAKWTDAVSFSLGAQEVVSAAQWSRLSSYWERRNAGLPLPFEGEESFALLRWLELKGIDFETGSSLFLAGPTLPNLGVQMDYRFDLSDLPWSSHGAESASVATKVLKSYTAPPWNSALQVQLATDVASAGHVREAIEFLNELVRLGVPAALSAIETIRAGS